MKFIVRCYPPESPTACMYLTHDIRTDPYVFPWSAVPEQAHQFASRARAVACLLLAEDRFVDDDVYEVVPC